MIALVWRRALAWLLTLLIAGAADRSQAADHRPPDILKTDILGVFAHPDDETGAAATLAQYALGRGATVANVYCTRGEGGGNMAGRQFGRALGLLREAELRDALALIGVRRCYFLDREDFAYTESALATFDRWGHEGTLEGLVRLVRALRPEVIITMNPAPAPGQHGNHQAAGWLAIEAFDAAADPLRFPEQLNREGLGVWRPRKLYFGGENGATEIKLDQKLPGGRLPGQAAAEAMSRHRSQGFGGARARKGRDRQRWTLVKSVVPFVERESDLFRGLPVEGDTPRRVLAPGDAPEPAALDFAFAGRPAVEFYQRAVRRERIEHVAVDFLPDLTVVGGEANWLRLMASNSTATAANASVVLTATDGWKTAPANTHLRFSPASRHAFEISVEAPAGLRADGQVVATASLDGGQKRVARARLHVAPRLDVPRTRALAVEAADEDPGWSALPSHFISHTNVWQGQPRDDADCSARFRVGHDGVRLYVEVRVADDHVVSNIEPDDIKGHWRSDSVELCVDPAGGAEHTLQTYKLGIFPFDSTGRVRGARDADARPGLVEETSPEARLVSWRTGEGYALRAAIPFSELGLQPEQHRRFGFNVLIYDGDKAGAAPGENINLSRLAWSPRSGVQGRPEDWGRADLQ